MPRIAASGLPISCASPADKRPTLAICSLRTSCRRASVRRAVVRVSSSTLARRASSSRTQPLGHRLNAERELGELVGAGARHGEEARPAGHAIGRAHESVERAHDEACQREVGEREEREGEGDHVERHQAHQRRGAVGVVVRSEASATTTASPTGTVTSSARPIAPRTRAVPLAVGLGRREGWRPRRRAIPRRRRALPPGPTRTRPPPRRARRGSRGPARARRGRHGHGRPPRLPPPRDRGRARLAREHAEERRAGDPRDREEERNEREQHQSGQGEDDLHAEPGRARLDHGDRRYRTSGPPVTLLRSRVPDGSGRGAGGGRVGGAGRGEVVDHLRPLRRPSGGPACDDARAPASSTLRARWPGSTRRWHPPHRDLWTLRDVLELGGHPGRRGR